MRSECESYLKHFLYRTKKKVLVRNRFRKGEGSFNAYTTASEYCKEQGFEKRSMQRNAPIALVRDVSYISKLRNIGPEEYDAIEGLMLSDDFRNGEVDVVLFVKENEQLEFNMNKGAKK